jgi:hypothetical protein
VILYDLILDNSNSWIARLYIIPSEMQPVFTIVDTAYQALCLAYNSDAALVVIEPLPSPNAISCMKLSIRPTL